MRIVKSKDEFTDREISIVTMALSIAESEGWWPWEKEHNEDSPDEQEGRTVINKMRKIRSIH